MSALIEEQDAANGLIVDGERLSLGVAARLSRYLQVLTQARKMGRETISSQELRRVKMLPVISTRLLCSSRLCV